MKEKETAIPFFKQPVLYTAIIALCGFSIFISSVLGKDIPNNFLNISFFGAIIFGAITYFLWVTRCPNCKRPFCKKECKEWKEDLGTKKEPYTYYSKVYVYSDGTKENVPESKKTIMRTKKYYRHYYICKKCKHGSNKDWKEEKGFWLGEAPKPKYVHKKGNYDKSTFFEEEKKTKKNRVPIKTSVKKQLFERADNACQLCGENKRQLHIHHIDKNPSNNTKTNLIVVCAGCHSIAESLTKVQLQNAAKKPYKKYKTINIYK